MVKFWPWGADEDAASFERTLSTLSTKISKAAAKNDFLRQRSRRVRVMWTLYAGFAYILAAIVLLLVTGWRSWGPIEVSVISGGPVLIYTVRTSLTTYYDYRISNTQAYLNRLNKERDEAIERLKAATKYNTTQQLLEKYGSPKQPSHQPSPSLGNKKQQGGPTNTKKQSQQPSGPRTGIAPPPTANIQRQPTPQLPTTPQRVPSRPPSAQSAQSMFPPPPIQDAPTAEFAPNAFAPGELTRQFSSSAATTFTQPHWYDRIMDALLGEDETQPKNRLALICSSCRLVNGQAPPGTRTLEDVGKWRCGGCRAWNGKEKPLGEEDVAGLVRGWEDERKVKERERGMLNVSEPGEAGEGGIDSDNREMLTEDDAGVQAEDEASASASGIGDDGPARGTRSKSRVKGRK